MDLKDVKYSDVDVAAGCWIGIVEYLLSHSTLMPVYSLVSASAEIGYRWTLLTWHALSHR